MAWLSRRGAFCAVFHACAIITSVVTLWAPAASAAWRSRGEISSENRFFLDDDDRSTVDQGVALFSRLEIAHKSKAAAQQLRVFGRLDSQDHRRTVMVVEEAWAEYKFNPFRLRVGVDIVNWTATEAFHPADIINARNIDSDIEKYEKLGEPMVMLSCDIGEGRLRLYYLPVYVNSIFPSPRSRLSFAAKNPFTGERFVLDDPLRLDAQGDPITGDFGPQGAVQWSQSFEGKDVALHVVHHLDRNQPQFTFNAQTNTPLLVFRTVTQAGGTYSQVIHGVIVKVEAAYRWFSPMRILDAPMGPIRKRDHGEVALGLEYGVPHESGTESTFLLEAQSILGVNSDVAAQLSIFQRDVMVGYRFAFNDEQSRELMASVIVDVQRERELLGSLSFKQRIGETFSLSVAARIFYAPVRSLAPRGLELLEQADHVRIALSRFF